MRKRTVKTVADTAFWYLLYFLPVLGFLLYLLAMPSGGVTLVGFTEFLQATGFEILTDNIIVTTLADIFGAGGVIPVFANNAVFVIFAWYVVVYLCHVCVDLLLCLPRLVHKGLEKLSGD